MTGVSEIAAQVGAARRGAVVCARPEVRTLRLFGPDRVRFLNGMVSADVARLVVGEGTTAVKTSPKGRVEGFLRVRAGADALFLDLRAVVADKILATLDRYIIADDCAIEDASVPVVSVLGPGAAAVVGAALPVLDNSFVGGLNGSVVIRDGLVGVGGYELHGGGVSIATLVAAGATPISAEALEVLRVESGIPIDGRELDEDTLPMEARLESAISSEKGCYVGQEVIARATLQGHVNYLLVGLRFEGEPPPEGAPLFAESDPAKPIGELCSRVWSPSLGAWIALAYVRRALEAPGTRLLAGEAARCTVTTLPFVP